MAVTEDTGIEIKGRLNTGTMLSISLFSENGKTVPNDGMFASLHASWAGRCVQMPADVFWPWVAGLVGVMIEVDVQHNLTRFFLDFDQAEKVDADQRYGLEVTGGTAWDAPDCRRVMLTLGEFWDALTALAEKKR